MDVNDDNDDDGIADTIRNLVKQHPDAPTCSERCGGGGGGSHRGEAEEEETERSDDVSDEDDGAAAAEIIDDDEEEEDRDENVDKGGFYENDEEAGTGRRQFVARSAAPEPLATAAPFRERQLLRAGHWGHGGGRRWERR